MSDVYLTLFLVGFLYAVVSVALVGLGHLGIHPPTGDAGHVDLAASDAATLPHAAGHADVGQAHGAPTKSGAWSFNLTVLMTFLLGFGGAGYVLNALTAWPPLLVGVGAAATGLGEAMVVSAVLTRLLRPDEGVLRLSDANLVGTIGRVTVPIRGSGVGEIVYTRLGSRHSVGARSANGRAIEQGAEVVVTDYDQGIATVELWDEFRIDAER